MNKFFNLSKEYFKKKVLNYKIFLKKYLKDFRSLKKSIVVIIYIKDFMRNNSKISIFL